MSDRPLSFEQELHAASWGPPYDEYDQVSFRTGARWAHDRDLDRIARLEAENRNLKERLDANPVVNQRELEAVAQSLVSRGLRAQCELSDDRGMERCRGDAVAVRWKAGFRDDVCEHHALAAEARGELVIREGGLT